MVQNPISGALPYSTGAAARIDLIGFFICVNLSQVYFFMNAVIMSQYRPGKSYQLDISIYFGSIFIFDRNFEINMMDIK